MQADANCRCVRGSRDPRHVAEWRNDLIVTVDSHVRHMPRRRLDQRPLPDYVASLVPRLARCCRRRRGGVAGTLQTPLCSDWISRSPTGTGPRTGPRTRTIPLVALHNDDQWMLIPGRVPPGCVQCVASHRPHRGNISPHFNPWALLPCVCTRFERSLTAMARAALPAGRVLEAPWRCLGGRDQPQQLEMTMWLPELCGCCLPLLPTPITPSPLTLLPFRNSIELRSPPSPTKHVHQRPYAPAPLILPMPAHNYARIHPHRHKPKPQ
jgi:hypothetical protein